MRAPQLLDFDVHVGEMRTVQRDFLDAVVARERPLRSLTIATDRLSEVVIEALLALPPSMELTVRGCRVPPKAATRLRSHFAVVQLTELRR